MTCGYSNDCCFLEGRHESPCLHRKGTVLTGALRDNKGKPPFSDVPYELLEAVASVLYKSSVEGGGKYPRNNWRKGAAHNVPLDSLLRHALKLAAGETHDAETGLPHSWHVACNAAFLVFYEKHFPELASWPKKGKE